MLLNNYAMAPAATRYPRFTDGDSLLKQTRSRENKDSSSDLSDQLQAGYDELQGATETEPAMKTSLAAQDKFLAYVDDMDSEEEAAEQKHSSCIVLPSNDSKFKFLVNETKKSPRNCN